MSATCAVSSNAACGSCSARTPRPSPTGTRTRPPSRNGTASRTRPRRARGHRGRGGPGRGLRRGARRCVGAHRSALERVGVHRADARAVHAARPRAPSLGRRDRTSVRAELVYLLLGGSLLLAAVLPQLLHRWALSAPIVLVAAGMLVGLLPMARDVQLDPVEVRPVIEHLTEVTVLVALMGVGLALDRPLRVAQPDVVARVVAGVATARHRHAPDHRRRRPARVGPARDRRPGGAAARGGAGAHGPGPGLRRPGRGAHPGGGGRGRGGDRRDRRGALLTDERGGTQRRARLPLRVRRDLPRHGGVRPGVAARLARVGARREGGRGHASSGLRSAGAWRGWRSARRPARSGSPRWASRCSPSRRCSSPTAPRRPRAATASSRCSHAPSRCAR